MGDWTTLLVLVATLLGMEEVEAACSTWAKEVAEIVNRVVNKRRAVVEIRRSEKDNKFVCIDLY
jgi:hypothetical protein